MNYLIYSAFRKFYITEKQVKKYKIIIDIMKKFSHM